MSDNLIVCQGLVKSFGHKAALAQLEQDGLAFADRTAGRLVTEDTSVLDAVRRAQARVLIEHYYDSMAELGYARTEAAELLKEEHL